MGRVVLIFGGVMEIESGGVPKILFWDDLAFEIAVKTLKNDAGGYRFTFRRWCTCCNGRYGHV